MSGIINNPPKTNREVDPFGPSRSTDNRYLYRFANSDLYIKNSDLDIDPPGVEEEPDNNGNDDNNDNNNSNKPTVPPGINSQLNRGDLAWKSLSDVMVSYILDDYQYRDGDSKPEDQFRPRTYVGNMGLVYVTPKTKFDPAYFELQEFYHEEFVYQPDRYRSLDAHTSTYNLSYIAELYDEIYDHFLQVNECNRDSQYTISEFSKTIIDDQNTYIVSRYNEDDQTFYSKLVHPYITNEDFAYFTTYNVMFSYEGSIINSTYEFGQIHSYLSSNRNSFTVTNIYPGEENILDYANHLDLDSNRRVSINIFEIDDSYIGKVVLNYSYFKNFTEISTVKVEYSYSMAQTHKCNKNNSNIPEFCQFSMYIDYIEGEYAYLTVKMSKDAYEFYKSDKVYHPDQFICEINDKSSKFVIRLNYFEFNVLEYETPEFEFTSKHESKILESDDFDYILSNDILTVRLLKSLKYDYKIISANIVSGTNSTLSIYPKIYFNDKFIDDRKEFEIICLGSGSFNIFISYYNPSNAKVETIQKTINVIQFSKDLTLDSVNVTNTSNGVAFEYIDNCPTSILPVFSPHNETDYSLKYDYQNNRIFINFDKKYTLNKVFYIDQCNVIRSYKIKNSTSSIEVFTLDDYYEYGENIESSYLYSIAKLKYIKPEIKIALSIIDDNEDNKGTLDGTIHKQYPPQLNRTFNPNDYELSTSVNNVDRMTSSIEKAIYKARKKLNNATTYANYTKVSYSELPSTAYQPQSFGDIKFPDQHDLISSPITYATSRIFPEEVQAAIVPWNAMINVYSDNVELEWTVDWLLGIEEKVATQKIYNLYFNKINKHIDTKRASFRFELSNRDYLHVYFDLDNCSIVKDGVKQDVVLIDQNSIKIFGSIDSKPICFLNSKGCDVSASGKVSVTQSDDEYITILISSSGSKKRIYLTFKYEIYGVIADDIRIEDRVVSGASKPRNSEIELKDSNFRKIYDSLQYNLYLDKNDKYTFVTSLTNTIKSVKLLTRYKEVEIYSNLNPLQPFELQLKPYFDKYKFIYALIIESENEKYGYRLYASFPEIFKGDLITSRLKRTPIYFYDDIISSWYDNEHYDDLLPDSTFYQNFAPAINKAFNTKNGSDIIKIYNNIAYLYSSSEESRLRYPIDYDKENQQYAYTYINTLKYIGYPLYYSMMNTIKQLGWNDNDNSTDLMYSLLSLDKLIYNNIGDHIDKVTTIDIENSEFKTSLTEVDYTMSNIDSILNHWKRKVAMHRKLIYILNQYDTSKSILWNIDNYINSVGGNTDIKMQQVAKLMTQVYQNKYRVKYWVSLYYTNRIWNAVANEYFWRNLVHILFDDILDFTVINDEILQDIYRYGFTPIINVPEMDENYRYVKYTIERSEDEKRVIPKKLEIKDNVYVLEENETFNYLFDKDGYVSGIQKINSEKTHPNYWKFYYTINDNKDYFEIDINGSKVKYDNLTTDISDDGILYYRGVRSYININQKIKSVRGNITNEEYFKKYGKYSLNKKVIINKLGDINSNVFEIRRRLGDQKDFQIMSGDYIKDYWIEADHNHIVKMYKKNIIRALDIQVHLNELFISELEKIANIIAAYRKNEKLKEIEKEINNQSLDDGNEIIDVTDFNITYMDFVSKNIYGDDNTIEYKYTTTYELFKFSEDKYSYIEDSYNYNIPINSYMADMVLSYTNNVVSRNIKTTSILPNTISYSSISSIEFIPEFNLLNVEFILNLEKYKDQTFPILITTQNINDNKPLKWSKDQTTLASIGKVSNYNSVKDYKVYENGQRNSTYAITLNSTMDLELDAISASYYYTSPNTNMIYICVNTNKFDNSNAPIDYNSYTYLTYQSSIDNAIEYCFNEYVQKNTNNKYDETYDIKSYLLDYDYSTYLGYITEDFSIFISTAYAYYICNTYKDIEHLSSPAYGNKWQQSSNSNDSEFCTYSYYFPYTENYNKGDYTYSYEVFGNSEKTTYTSYITFGCEKLYNGEYDPYDYYLGSAFEWQLIQDNAHEINTYMKTNYPDINWQPFYDGTNEYDDESNKTFWTSTQKNANEAMPMFFDKQMLNYTPKWLQYYVRPFALPKKIESINIKIYEYLDTINVYIGNKENSRPTRIFKCTTKDNGDRVIMVSETEYKIPKLPNYLTISVKFDNKLEFKEYVTCSFILDNDYLLVDKTGKPLLTRSISITKSLNLHSMIFSDDQQNNVVSSTCYISYIVVHFYPWMQYVIISGITPEGNTITHTLQNYDNTQYHEYNYTLSTLRQIKVNYDSDLTIKYMPYDNYSMINSNNRYYEESINVRKNYDNINNRLYLGRSLANKFVKSKFTGKVLFYGAFDRVEIDDGNRRIVDPSFNPFLAISSKKNISWGEALNLGKHIFTFYLRDGYTFQYTSLSFTGSYISRTDNKFTITVNVNKDGIIVGDGYIVYNQQYKMFNLRYPNKTANEKEVSY